MNRVCRHSLIVFLASAVFGAGVAAAQSNPKVAVMPTRDDSGQLDRQALEVATGYLRTKIAESSNYIVIDKSRQAEKRREVVQDLKEESYEECYDESCQIEVGQALMADRALSTTVGKLGDVCMLQAEMIALAKEATVDGASAEFDCTASGLREAVDKIAAAIGAGGSEEEEEADERSAERGYLTLETRPEEVPVSIDGRPAGETPLRRLALETGEHEVVVDAECREQLVRTVEIEPEAERRLAVEVPRGEVDVKVDADSRDGEPLEAEVVVDGRSIGQTPGSFEVPACSEQLEIRHDDYETYETSLAGLDGGASTQIEAVLSPRSEPDRTGTSETATSETTTGQTETTGTVETGEITQRGGPSVGPILFPVLLGGGSLFRHAAFQLGTSLGWGVALSNRVTLEIEGEFAGGMSFATEAAVEDFCSGAGPSDSDDEFGSDFDSEPSNDDDIGCSALSSGWQFLPQLRLHWFTGPQTGIDLLAGLGYGQGQSYEVGSANGAMLQVGAGVSVVKSVISFEFIYSRMLTFDSPGSHIGLRMRTNWVGGIAEGVQTME